MPWIVSVACSPWKHVFCDIPSRASGAKLRHSEEMVLIVSGILVKDRSGRITSICYAIEPSHLPCSIYSHQQGIRWSVIPFESVWYHPLDFRRVEWIFAPVQSESSCRSIISENLSKKVYLFASSARCSGVGQDSPGRPLPWRYHSSALW